MEFKDCSYHDRTLLTLEEFGYPKMLPNSELQQSEGILKSKNKKHFQMTGTSHLSPLNHSDTYSK